MRTNGSRTRLVAMAVALAMCMATAPIAHADEHDDAFVTALKRRGIVPIGDPAGVVSWAHWSCDQLANGSPKEHVIAWLGQQSPQADNSVLLRTAALYYCPELKGKAGW